MNISIHTHYAQLTNPGIAYIAAVIYDGNTEITRCAKVTGTPMTNHVAGVCAAGLGVNWLATQTERDLSGQCVWLFISLMSAMNAAANPQAASGSLPLVVRRKFIALADTISKKDITLRVDWQKGVENPAHEIARTLCFERTGKYPKEWGKR